jgi:thiol-disulfide isomerase/thioredoxin
MAKAAFGAGAERLRRCAAVGVLALAACSDPQPEVRAEPSAAPGAALAKPELVPVPFGVTDGPAFLRSEYERAEREQRKLVVYVGATWCEPCKYFHDALKRGELDADLAGVRFLDFDLEAHGALLDASGCTSKMVPLFARPTQDGMCSDRRTQGGVKGDGAVRFILPRLKRIL